MKLRKKISAGIIFLKYIMFNIATPIAARINLTNRCTQKCRYCNLWKKPSKEMTTDQVKSLVLQLSRMGTKMISFSGGEPLLRKDIGQILSYCKKFDISTNINTSGFLLGKKTKELKDLGMIQFSIDGIEEYNDMMRGKGSYKAIMAAIDKAKKVKIPFCFNTTLTKQTATTENIIALLNLAKKHNTYVVFQPYKEMHKGARDKRIDLEKEKFKKAVDFLIRKKQDKKWSACIRNTRRGLMHIRKWPNYDDLKCTAGRLFIVINPNGDVLPCDRADEDFPTKPYNFLEVGLKKAYKKIPEIKCSGCGFSGGLELTYLSKLYPDVIIDMFRFI